MGWRPFQPHDDGRWWTYTNIGFRRGAWHGGPYRRRGRRSRRRPPEVYAVVMAVLALFGGFALGGLFVALLSRLVKQ